MSAAPDLILQGLLHPESLSGLSQEQWDLLVRQGRRANILGKLACHLDDQGSLERPPDFACHHLVSAAAVARQQGNAIRWEVACILVALAPTGIPLVLLKGAAYVMAGLPAAKGRVFSDVDIIAPKEAIPEVESALMLNGWTGGHHTDYDQRYYRRWMHEIPPMEHIRRGTVVDVHHAILPETARIQANSRSMLAAAVPVPGHANVFVFSPIDMVLHSATHLFHEGELDNGLRDLLDLDSLFRHFGGQPGFWDNLAPRAMELGLTRPLYYALRYAEILLGTPVPVEAMRAASAGKPPVILLALMDRCLTRALRPHHATCSDRWTPAARWLLYVRSHWLRMPFFLLVYHLTRKALTPAEKPTDETAKRKVEADGP